MDHHDAAAAYKQASIENAPPVKIIRMLFEGAVRFLDRAERCDPRDPKSRFTYWVGRADAIVCELRMALDPTQSIELTASLEALYLFCEERLGHAVSRRETAPLQEARAILRTLREAWADVEAASREPV